MAVGTVAGIALVAVTLVVVIARTSNSPAEADSAVDEEVPTALVGGIPPADVPGEVAAAFDVPVIGAARLDELPDGVVEACTQAFGPIVWDEGEPSIEDALATPDAIHATVVGTGDAQDMGMGPDDAPNGFRLRCSVQMEDGRWTSDGGGFEPVMGDGEPPPDFGGGGYSCCDDNGLATATAGVAVPANATWGLQDRTSWVLAYPTGDRKSLTLSWKFREQRFGPGGPPQTPITFVDDDGTVISEVFVGGEF